MQILFWFYNNANDKKYRKLKCSGDNIFLYHVRYLHAKNDDLFAKIEYDYGRPERFQPLSEPCVNATSA